MNHFEELKKQNPNIRFYSVLDPEFERYGHVIGFDTKEFCDIIREKQVMPESGSCYVPTFAPIENSEKAAEYDEVLCGQIPHQWGLCWGYNSKMTALEYHTSNEFNIAVTELVLILGKRADIEKDGRYDAEKCAFFYAPEGVMFECYADTLHYGPCMVTKEGFSLVVGLPKNTNTDVDTTIRRAPLLMAKNKWLLAHESEAELIASGAKGLVYGPNHVVKTV